MIVPKMQNGSKLVVNPPCPTAIASIQGAEQVFDFAMEAHVEQRRKWTETPYIYHPSHVASILIEAFGSHGMLWYLETEAPEIVYAALLHDTVEDCGVTFTELDHRFGTEARNLVFWLTDAVPKSAGNRATRKGLQNQMIGHAPLFAKMVKLADMISNTIDIAEHDPKFAVSYVAEKKLMLDEIHYHGAGIPDAEWYLPEVFKTLFETCERNF